MTGKNLYRIKERARIIGGRTLDPYRSYTIYSDRRPVLASKRARIKRIG